mmetsp:Transcript_16109/g.40392  ORF Transcript_16109/g.40392 Transcript_16109/m.40392 type:complete len:599 (+) Transcript_16109:180-1976(+)
MPQLVAAQGGRRRAGRSWCQALRVAREEGRLANVVQAAEEHDDALQAHTRAAVRRAAVLERVDVGLDAVERDSPPGGALREKLGVVDTLRARDDLLTADEDVKGVGVVVVVGAGHGVEGADGQGVAVQEVKVGLVLLLHQLAQGALHLRVEVIVRANLVAGICQHLDALRKGELQGLAQVLQRLEGVLLPDDLQLLAKALVEAVEHVHKESVQHVQHLKVVLLDLHLHVQPRELTQVAVSVGILRPEDGTNLKDPAKVGRDGHLLVQLRALRQAARLPHVLQLEHRRAALAGAALQLGGVDLHKALAQQRLAEQQPGGALKAEDGLVGGRAQVDVAVVQAGVLIDRHEALLCRLARRAGGVGDLKRQDGGAADDLDGGDHDLYLLAAALDGGLRHRDAALHVHDRLARDAARVLHHALAHRHVVHKHGALHRGRLLPEHQEGGLALAPHGVHAAAKQHCGVLQLRGERGDVCPHAPGDSHALHARGVAVLVGQGVVLFGGGHRSGLLATLLGYHAPLSLHPLLLGFCGRLLGGLLADGAGAVLRVRVRESHGGYLLGGRCGGVGHRGGRCEKAAAVPLLPSWRCSGVQAAVVGVVALV